MPKITFHTNFVLYLALKHSYFSLLMFSLLKHFAIFIFAVLFSRFLLSRFIFEIFIFTFFFYDFHMDSGYDVWSHHHSPSASSFPQSGKKISHYYQIQILPLFCIIQVWKRFSIELASDYCVFRSLTTSHRCRQVWYTHHCEKYKFSDTQKTMMWKNKKNIFMWAVLTVTKSELTISNRCFKTNKNIYLKTIFLLS